MVTVVPASTAPLGCANCVRTGASYEYAEVTVYTRSLTTTRRFCLSANPVGVKQVSCVPDVHAVVAHRVPAAPTSTLGDRLNFPKLKPCSVRLAPVDVGPFAAPKNVTTGESNVKALTARNWVPAAVRYTDNEAPSPPAATHWSSLSDTHKTVLQFSG